MIDIATIPVSSTSTLSAAFDWALMLDAGREQNWIDTSNLCAGLITHTTHLDNTYALALEAGLHTAVIHSLFTDARAGRDDPLPYNNTDKRGWLGEAFLPQVNKSTQYGSRLWLNYYTKATGDEFAQNVLEAQRFAAVEALSWLVDEGVVDAVDVAADFVHKDGTELLALHITMSRLGTSSPIYDAVWGTTMRHAEGYYAAA